MGKSNICSDDSGKCVTSVMLVTTCVGIVVYAGYIFIFSYLELADFVLEGNQFLPGFSVSFKSFSWYIFFCIACCVGLLLVSLIAAQCKKPYTACAFATMALGSAVCMFLTAKMALNYNYLPENFC